MKARFIGLNYLPKARFLEIDEPGTQHRNIIGKNPDGKVVYAKRETRVMIILAAPGARKVTMDIYPKLREMFPSRRITRQLIDRIRDRLNNSLFEVDGDTILNLEEKLRTVI